jgi:hypothetical protein
LPASPDFFEFIFNGDDLTENNIDTVEVETYSTLSNYIIGKDTTTGKLQVKDDPSITAFGVFAEYKSFRD